MNPILADFQFHASSRIQISNACNWRCCIPKEKEEFVRAKNKVNVVAREKLKNKDVELP